MLKRKQPKADNCAGVQECSGYEPIQTAKIDSMELGSMEMEDAGCDSCIHYHNGECEVYRK
jgi:hypothetical protein